MRNRGHFYEMFREAQCNSSSKLLQGKAIDVTDEVATVAGGMISQKTQTHLKLAVGIATVARPAILSQMLRRLSAQTRAPDAVVVCAPKSADVEGIAELFPEVTILIGPQGSSHQRNVILRSLHEFDVVIFFDDDFVPCSRYLEKVEQIMSRHSDIVITTGNVLADGARGASVTFESADTILKNNLDVTEDAGALRDVFNGYGCNMSVRLAPTREHSLAFDEKLPLYAWLEDIDFSQQLAAFGRVVEAETTRGVHLGVRSGRQSGYRFGYSQIANPLYLIRKGTCNWRKGFYIMIRNLAANIIRSFWPEKLVDRRGRLSGNVRAILELLSGRLDPRRVRSLQK